MADVVVTIPMPFWKQWLAEGDCAGDAPTQHYYFYSVPAKPIISPGERVYVVAFGKLRGYAPLVLVESEAGHRFSLVRGGNAVAVAIPQKIKSFRGYRYRWWDRSEEIPFPNWKEP